LRRHDAPGHRLGEENQVAELKITVNCRSMLISTAFFRFCKGVEHCYYALLFTSGAYSRAGAGPWQSWLEVGFHLAERQAPPAATAADRLSLDARPGRNFEVSLSTSNASALERLENLLREVDRVRRGLGADDNNRLPKIIADQKIETMLLAPLREALKRGVIAPQQTEAFSNMIHRGLLAMCDRQITSIETARL
jgi:hypothetical protein